MASPHHAIKRELIKIVPSIHHEHENYKWWILINVMIGTFIAVLDATIVNVGLPKIMASLSSTVDKIEWIMTGYMLSMGVMLPASGWIADHFGYKKTYFTALLVFTFGSFLCGFSWSENSLIFFRVVQGIGAGLLMPVGMAIVLREFPPEKRGMALGFWGIAAAASVSFGPFIGGYLIDNINWPAIFFVNVPIGIFGMFATLIIMREYKSEKIRSFDFAGFISATVFLTSILLALSSGNSAWNTGGWSSPFIIFCFTVALVSLIIFLIVESREEHPFIDIKLFKDFNFAFSNAILFIFGIGMFGSTFLMPLYWQNALGYTAVQAGMMFMPVGILQGFISPVSGAISDRFNPKIPAFIGIGLLAFSLYLNTKLTLETEKTYMFIILCIRGLAMGLIFIPLSSISLAGVPREKTAQASGLFNVIRQVGGSFGIAIFGTILARRTLFHMAVYGQAMDPSSPAFKNTADRLAGHISHNFSGSADMTRMQAGAIIASNLSKQAFVQAINDDFFVASIITILVLIPVFFLRTGKNKKVTGEKTELVE